LLPETIDDLGEISQCMRLDGKNLFEGRTINQSALMKMLSLLTIYVEQHESNNESPQRTTVNDREDD
jgi:hypothetical protein